MRAHRLLVVFAALLLFSCKKETEQFQTDAITDYIPLVAGKYITYRIDSTIFTNFGTVTATRSYQEKHQVDALTTDNLGRPSYRVFRYIRDTAGAQAWKPSGSYFITPTTNAIEVIENNLRVQRLAAPIRQDKSWRGNEFLPTEPYGNFYDFSNDDDMADWEFVYTGVGESLKLNGTTVNNVVTVQESNESANAPVTQPQTYGYINYSVNKYAKGIGLVYQEFTMWDYQPDNGSKPAHKTGFGVKRSMIDHN